MSGHKIMKMMHKNLIGQAKLIDSAFLTTLRKVKFEKVTCEIMNQ